MNPTGLVLMVYDCDYDRSQELETNRLETASRRSRGDWFAYMACSTQTIEHTLW